jgi:hypothetical protein
VWHEQPRIRSTFPYAPLELLVHQDMQSVAAMRTRGHNFNLQSFASEAPFDEGRNKGVLRSSAEDLLSRAESQSMRRPLAGNGKGPAHIAAAVSHQKKQMFFEIVEQLDGQSSIQAQ